MREKLLLAVNMKESRIIKSIKFHTIKYLLDGEYWHIDKLFAYAVAIIYPFTSQVKFDNQNQTEKLGTIKQLVEVLTKFLRTQKFNNLDILSFEGMVSFFVDKLCPNVTYATKKECLSESITLISSISEDGYIAWKGKTEVYNSIVKTYEKDAYLYEYGRESYNVISIAENKPYSIGDEIICSKEVWPKIVESEPKYTHNNYAITENVEKNSHNLKNEICKLYDKFVVDRGGDEKIKELEYIWQWLISDTEYKYICSVLNKCKESHNKKSVLNNTKCIWMIVAYVAEQYKREWNGYDRKDNALLQIGLEHKAKAIAEQYFKDHSDRIFINSNGSYAEWLESLRMEGGLPAKYIVDKNKLDFTKDIYTNPLKAIEALEDTHNKTRIYSYNQKHSIYEYIQALIAKRDVYSKEDAEHYPFKDFQEILEEGREDARKRASKFEVEYAVWRWRYSDEFVIHQQVNLKSAKAYLEDQESFSLDRIQNVWEIAKPTYVFWLRIGNKDYEFYPVNGGYRSTTGRIDFPLDDVDPSSPKSLRVQITYIPQGADGQKEANESKWKDISNDIVEESKNYILFSSKDGNKWYQGRFGSKGAVLVLNKSIKVEPIGYMEEVQLDGGMRWIEFDSLIKINGKTESIGHLEIRPREEALHPIVKYVQNIKLQRNNNIENIWILKSSAIKEENFEKITDDGKTSSINKIEYRNNDSGEYKKMDKSNIVLDGLTIFRLDDNKVVKAFVLPDNAGIRRDVGNERIIISNFNDVNIKGIEGFHRNSNTYQKDFRYNDIDDPANTTCQICIQIDDSQKIVMEVVYPWRRQVRILGRNTTTEKTIPRKFASRYKLLDFDENGVRYIEDKKSIKKYNRRIQINHGRYRVGSEEGLEFVFMATDGTEYPLNIEKVADRTGAYSYYLAGIPTGEKGVIFQSLKNKSSELAYYEHLYVDCKDRVVFHMGSKIAPFVKCEEHNLYYDVLLYKEMLTPKWFFNYCEDCISQKRVINYKHLWLAAKDCEVDWILDFPRAEWLNAMRTKECENKKEWVIQLFRYHPQYYTNDLEEFIDKYWALKWSCRAPQKGSDDYKKFLFFAVKCEFANNRNGNKDVIYTYNNGNPIEIKWEIPKKIPTFTGIDIECEISK